VRAVAIGTWTVVLSILLPSPYGIDAQVFLKPMEIHEGVFLTSHSVNLITDESFFRAAEPSEIDVASVAREFYRYFPDSFDFLLVFSGMPMKTSLGAHFPVRNTTSGIGHIEPVRTVEGIERLQSLIFINFENCGGVGPIIHEIAHRWGNYLEPLDRTFHWEYSDVGGVLGGHYTDFEAVGDDRYLLTGFKGSELRGGVFADLALYLMGLIPTSEITRDFRVIRDAAFIEKSEDGQDLVSGRLETITIDDVIEAHGPRIPDHGNAQQAFTAAVIAVSTIPLGLECVEYFDRVSMLISSARDSPSAFATATGHRATLETRLDHFLPTPTVVDVNDSGAPRRVELTQNVPNPFNGATSIQFTLPRSEHVELSIFNAAGQFVFSPALGRMAAGAHQVHWDGRDSAGRSAGSGVYFYRLTVAERSQVRKLLLLP